jgi:hypothetical protein
MKKKRPTIGEPFVKVGRIGATLAQHAHIRAADIYVSRNHLLHIEKKHGTELSAVGLDALSFVRAVCRDFNQIRHGSGSSLLLVVFRGDMSHVAAIDMNYSVKEGFWEIKTASPRNSEAVLRKPLVWAGAHPAGGNGYRPY